MSADKENFFAFVVDASTDENLAKIRHESERKTRDDVEDEVVNSDGELSEDDDEQKGKRKKKNLTRIFSPTLKELIFKHSPAFACDEHEAETSCLFRFTRAHVPFFGNAYTDLDLFDTQLADLSNHPPLDLHRLHPKLFYVFHKRVPGFFDSKGRKILQKMVRARAKKPPWRPRARVDVPETERRITNGKAARWFY